jgi:hypothetical protein
MPAQRWRLAGKLASPSWSAASASAGIEHNSASMQWPCRAARTRKLLLQAGCDIAEVRVVKRTSLGNDCVAYKLALRLLARRPGIMI